MRIIPDASAATLRSFLADNVEPGSRVITDGWSGCQGFDRLGYSHEPRSQRAARARGEDPGGLLPGVHRVASLVKRWLLDTHQSGINHTTHPQAYLNEFTFRFNRRTSKARGLLYYRVLELAVAHDPVRYTDLVADPRPKPVPPRPPGGGRHPPSLGRPRASRPWHAKFK